MIGRCLLGLALVTTSSAWGQAVISAHSGVVQYVEGRVTLDGKAVQPKFAQFPDVKAGQTLAAEDGRAEVLLTPGVFLRLAENSSLRMISNLLADTKLEVISGSALIEVGELLKDNAITVQFHDASVELVKKGLYRFDADGGSLRVYDGEARVTAASEKLVARRGREIEFGDQLEARNFDTKDTDAFYRWGERRDEYVSEANVLAAKSSYTTGTGAGSWAWNPWFGMFSFVPATGLYYSPFGYAFFSPAYVNYFYYPSVGSFGRLNSNSYTFVSSPQSRPGAFSSSTPAPIGHASSISPGGMSSGVSSGSAINSTVVGGMRSGARSSGGRR